MLFPSSVLAGITSRLDLEQSLFLDSVRKCPVDAFVSRLLTNMRFVGYAQNGAAAATLEIFDVASGTFLTSYTPPSAVTTPTVTTLPIPGQTGAPSHPGGTGQPGSAEFPSPTGTGGGNPDATQDPGNPSGAADDSHHGTTIALATVFGVLALVSGTTVVTWYLRRRHSRDSFHLLGASGDEESPTSDAPIPVAGIREKGLPLPPVVRTVKDRLSKVVPGMVPPPSHAPG